jgi:hypothetical protein
MKTKTDPKHTSRGFPARSIPPRLGRHGLAGMFALLAGASILPAQSLPEASLTTTTPVVRPVTPIHSQIDDHGAAYGLWAAGSAYKASFHDGLQFVPYLGRARPENATFGWRTVSATIGERQLVRQAPRLRHDALRAEYDLGGIVEAYDVHPEGLEQTFVLQEPPRGGGDLVVRGEVTGVLRPEPLQGHGPVGLVDEHGVRCATYGAATAIDAAGRRVPMTTRAGEGFIELVLGAQSLVGLEFPLVVDPLLTPMLVTVTSDVVGDVDVQATVGTMPSASFVAEVVYASASDADLRYLAHNVPQSVTLYADLSAQWSTAEPSLGFCAWAGSTLLAFSRTFVGDGTRRIRMHRHANSMLSLDNSVVLLEHPESRNCWRPAVGTDINGIQTPSLLVVFQVEGTGSFTTVPTSRIRAALVDVSTAVPATILQQFDIAAPALTDCERPAIGSVQHGFPRTWTVAWQSYLGSGLFPNGLQWDVQVRRVGDDGTLGPTFTVPASPNEHQMAPRIAGIDDRMMLVYTESSPAESSIKPAGANGHRVRTVRLDHGPAGFTLPHGTKLLQSTIDARNQVLGIADDPMSRSHWHVLLHLTSPEELHFVTCGYTGTVMASSLAHGTFSGSFVGGAVNVRGTTVAMIYAVSAPALNDVIYVRGFDWPNLFPTIDGPAACSTATILWAEPPLIGSEFAGPRLQNIPANGFGLVLVGTQSLAAQVLGVPGVHDGCWVLVPLSGPDHVGVLGPALGPEAHFPLPLPEFLQPQTIYVQGVLFDPGSSELFSTRRLNVPIGK